MMQVKLLVLEPIRSAEPMVLNDPVTTKLPDMTAAPVNGNAGELPLPPPPFIAYEAVRAYVA